MLTAIADRFRKMADAIERNADNFGGAFVVVPPKDAGDPIETLILDVRQDAAQFWILLKSKCEAEIAKADQQQRAQQGFARR